VWVLAASIGLSAAALGHEYWLEPIATIAPGGTTVWRAWVGEGMTAEKQVSLYPSKPKRALLRTPSGEREETFAPDLSVKGADGSPLEPAITEVAIRRSEPGTSLLALHGEPKFIELESSKFDAYLQEDGLESILTLRRSQGPPPGTVRERYSRCAKTVFAVGKPGGDAATRATELPLDVIPTVDPTTLQIGRALTVEVRFRGQPLPKALVRAWMRGELPTKEGEGVDASKLMTSVKTDGAGRASIPITAAGNWLVATVHMIAAEEKGHDYESFWGSLTFHLASKEAPGIESVGASAPASRPQK